MVKRGGALVYATCLLKPEGNDEVARGLPAAQPAFAIDAPADFPIPLGPDGFTAIRFQRGA